MYIRVHSVLYILWFCQLCNVTYPPLQYHIQWFQLWYFKILFLFIYFFRLYQVLVVACMWDLVSWPGIEPGPPALGARTLTHWTTREVPGLFKKKHPRRFIGIAKLRTTDLTRNQEQTNWELSHDCYFFKFLIWFSVMINSKIKRDQGVNLK